MLHIIKACPSAREDAVLRAMFAARKCVFVDLLGWDLPVIDGQYEVDQFDDAAAAYLVLTDEQGAHLGSARLLSTTGPHILADLFAHLCEGPLPRGPAIFEITRFCLDRRLRAAERRRVRDALVGHLVDHALAAGITTYTAIAQEGWCEQILGFGWRCARLGTADAGRLSALRIEIDEDTPRRLAAAGLIATSLPSARRAAA